MSDEDDPIFNVEPYDGEPSENDRMSNEGFESTFYNDRSADAEAHEGSEAELDAALTGLQDAAAYARTISHHGIAAEIETLYQKLGKAAPSDDWVEDE